MAATLAIVVVVALIGGSWLLSYKTTEQKTTKPNAENNNSTSTNETKPVHDVEITDFEWGGWSVPVGVTAAIGFNITIHNYRTTDIEDLKIDVKMLDNNGNELQEGVSAQEELVKGQYTWFDGELKAGATRTLEVSIFTGFVIANEVWASAKGLTTTTVSLKHGDKVLDELAVIR